MDYQHDASWFEQVVKGLWRDDPPLFQALTSPNMPWGIPRTDERGRTALHRLLLESQTPDTFDGNLAMLEALSNQSLSPWDRDLEGRCAYQDLIEQHACHEVLLWCWTRSMEPGHAEVCLSARILSDRLAWILKQFPVPGSPEQSRWRQTYGLTLPARWADGTTTLQRILEVCALPDQAEAPGVVFQGLVALMKECAAGPCFSDEMALLGVWWAHACAHSPPGSLICLFERWAQGLPDRCHEIVPAIPKGARRWAWGAWLTWLGRQESSSLWACYGAWAACRVAQQVADTEGGEAARECLLTGLKVAGHLWTHSSGHSPAVLTAWQKAWDLWVMWSAWTPTPEVPPDLWFLLVPLWEDPSVSAWVHGRPSLPSLPSVVPEAWQSLPGWAGRPGVLP